jgi:hypothetical protein
MLCQPRIEPLEMRQQKLLLALESLLGRSMFGFSLGLVKRKDIIQSVFGMLRVTCLCVNEVSPDMHPAELPVTFRLQNKLLIDIPGVTNERRGEVFEKSLYLATSPGIAV